MLREVLNECDLINVFKSIYSRDQYNEFGFQHCIKFQVFKIKDVYAVDGT